MISRLPSSVALLSILCFGCDSRSSDTSTARPGNTDPSPSARVPSQLPQGPGGTIKIAAEEFQLYVPEGWITRQRSDSPYYRLKGEWNVDNATQSGFAGSIDLGRFPANGLNLRELADKRVAMFKSADGVQIAHSEIEPITLADGTDAIYVLVQMDGSEVEHRTLNHCVLARESPTEDAYWMVVMSLVGDPDNEVMDRNGATCQLIRQCVRSFVPAPAGG